MLLFKGRETHARSLAKAISWRILGSLDTFVIGYVFTRNATAAGGIALTEVFTKIALFTFHERAWNKVKWGYTDNVTPTPQQIDDTPEPK